MALAVRARLAKISRMRLPLAHVCARVGIVETLQECLHRDSARGVGQEGQLVEILVGLRLVLLFADEPHEHRTLGQLLVEYLVNHIVR